MKLEISKILLCGLLLISFQVRALADELDGKIKQCEKKYFDVCEELGNHFFSAGEWEQATIYFDKACDKDHLTSCHQLAMAFAKEGNKTLTKYYLDNACDFGHRPSCNDLKELERIAQENAETAKKFDEEEDKKLAKKKAIEEARMKKEQAAEEAKKEKTEAQYQRLMKIADDGCKKNHSPKQCISYGIEKYNVGEKETAQQYFERACDLKNSEGCRLGGLVAGENGSINYGDRLLKEACNMKNREACKNLDYLQQKATEAAAVRERELEEQSRRERREVQQAAYERQQQLIEDQNQAARQRAMGQMLFDWGSQQMPRRQNCMTMPLAGGGFTTQCY